MNAMNPILAAARKPELVIASQDDALIPDEQSIEEPRKTKLPLIRGFQGFDVQASYLIKGYLPADCTASIYGPSGSFKSFLAVSWACHIATGKQWNERKTEAGAVLYVVGEGGVGVPRRIRAWADQYNQGEDVPNIFRVDMPVFMADQLQVAELRLAANQVKSETGLDVKLIVIDTVARCFGGGDENKASDMGAFIAGCDMVKAATGATILLVHHTGKQEANGARGSSAFKAALDAEYLVKREGDKGDSLVLKATKMKDSEQPEAVAFDLKSRVITFDSDGDEVTSLVLIDKGREPADPEELDGIGNISSNHKAMYQTIRDLCEKGDGKAPWRAVQASMKQAGTWDTKKGSRWRDKLREDGLISVDGDEISLCSPE
ncbi:helicase RepA family protein [Aeromonas sp. S41-2]|uniref:helicase RepA family protein n=1 Tax=Aeromonas sp. S41-2 TaxID=2990502 RepID=UPI0022E709DF|nr:helicase RepA family protein [Aeromonas sp. S41-2]